LLDGAECLSFSISVNTGGGAPIRLLSTFIFRVIY
jgi:hypothetical protein